MKDGYSQETAPTDWQAKHGVERTVVSPCDEVVYGPRRMLLLLDGRYGGVFVIELAFPSGDPVRVLEALASAFKQA
jgi:hypothetical protein